MRHNSRNKQGISKGKTVLATFLGIALILLLAVYIAGGLYYQEHFLPGTKINGIDISNQTAKEVTLAYDTYELTVQEKSPDGGTVSKVLTGKEAGMLLGEEDTFQKMLEKQPNWRWFMPAQNKDEEHALTVQADKVEDFADSLDGLTNTDAAPPIDAKLSDYVKGEGYSVIPEVAGEKLVREKTITVLTEALENLEASINLEEMDCYEHASITSDNKKLNALAKKLNKWLSTDIQYKFADEVENVDEEKVQPWIVLKGNKASLDKEKIKEFVASMRSRYDTIFRNRSFKTSYGKTITIEGGDYGWWMNTGEEEKQLLSLIKKGKKGERTPAYYQTAAAYGKKDYGNSYVEVNLTAQHLYLYIKGKKILESDFVSGNTSRGNGTPQGVYSMTYKEEMAQLIGETYSTPVSYWMPFNGNIGLHDASWRSSFGASLYKTGGSHGCINLPCKVAKKIYSYVEKGFPVVCYELPGTESTQVTSQSSEDIAKMVVDSINKIGKNVNQSKKRIEHSRRIYNELNSSERRYVTNYQKLVDAEAKLS